MVHKSNTHVNAAGGVTSINGETGDVNIVSNSFNITTPGPNTIEIEPGQIGGTYLGDTVTGAQTITLVQYAPYAFSILSLRNLGTVSGSVTGTLNINGVPVTGISGLALTTVTQTGNASGANSVVAGDKITFVTSSPSGLTGLLPFSLIGLRS